MSLMAVGLGGTLALGQDTTQKVTFSSKATSAKLLLEKLSKTTGVTFATSPQTADEVLLVDVADAPLSDLMKQIAKAAGAEWQAEGEGFRLVRPSALNAQQEREYLADRAAKIQKQQKEFQDTLNGQKPLTAAEAAKIAETQRRQVEEITSAASEGRRIMTPQIAREAVNANPTSRLMLKLVTSFAPADLARIPAGARVVFSSMPTRVQRPLPAAAGRAIADFVREAEIWLSAMPPQAQTPDPTRQVFIGLPGGNLSAMEGGLGKVLFIVQRSQFNDGLQVEVRVADRAGKIAANTMRMLSLGGGANFFAGGRVVSTSAAPANPAPAPASGGAPLEVSNAGKEHAAFMMQSPSRNQVSFIASPATAGGGTRVSIATTVEAFAIGGAAPASPNKPLALSQEWRGQLLRPDLNEPLGYVVSDLFSSLAKVRKRNLVASLSDRALIALSTRAQQRVTDVQLLEMAQNELDMKVEESDGWLNVQPKFPFHERSVRVDREELGRLLGSIQKDGRMTLDALCRYALSRSQPAPNPAFDLRYVNALFPTEAGDFQAASGNWKIHQLYATLSADQRRSLGNGGRLALGSLSNQQAAIVNAMVYDDLQGPLYREIRPGQNPNEAAEYRSMMFATEGGMIMSMGPGQTLLNERTEFLPAGVPPNGILTLQASTQDAVLATKKDGSADARFFTAEAYGAYTGIAPNIVLAGSSGGNLSMPVYDTFRPAQQQALDFLFEFSPQASLSKQLRDAWFLPGSTAGSFNMLPPSFRQRVEETAKRMGESRGTISLGAPAGRNRPPAH